MPPLREGDRYFWGYAIGAATALTTFLVPEETEIKYPQSAGSAS
jgi:hypothetical protein